MRSSFPHITVWIAAIAIAACQPFDGPKMNFDALAGTGEIAEAGSAGGRALESLKTAPEQGSHSQPDAAPAPDLRARVDELFDAYPHTGNVQDGAKFAGRYVVRLEPCGTGCQNIRLIDVETGEKIEGPAASVGARWRADSRLMIINDPYVLGAFAPADIPQHHWPRCYLLDGSIFKSIACKQGEIP